MAEREQNNHPHFIFQNSARVESFKSPPTGGGGSDIPAKDRNSHGGGLLEKLHQLTPVLAEAAALQREAGVGEGIGLQIEFESFPDVELAFESLARERSGIELLNVRYELESKRTFATVLVPDGKLERFEQILRDYLRKKRDKRGRLLDHKRLVNAIQ